MRPIRSITVLFLRRRIAFSICLAVLATGCGSADSGAKNANERLRRTRADIETGTGNSSSDAQRNEYERIAAALKAADTASLETPTLCATTYFPKYDSKHGMLMVDWIGLEPQADGIRLEWPGHKTKDLLMSREEIEDNAKTSRSAVLYSIGFQFTPGSPEEKDLLHDPRPMVFLIKNSTMTSAGHDLYVASEREASSGDTPDAKTRSSGSGSGKK